ncbi:FAD-dependent monooxygenase [Fodinicola feengrottensis]|uniref:FAD-dependent monooxygenase n=1 Tax=Fodinicola feengrottensis TaxID=435914 RepID=UPI0013D5B1B9|nr:FAD-dependent monooxygenase [Fodinicola feengrottensis]
METFDDRTPVLIAGGGLVGLAASLFLARQGIRSLLVDRHPGVSIHGRARGINQRTMEIYRAFGIEADVLKAGAPFDDEAGVARCETLAGPWEWLYEQEAPRAWPDLTAGEFCMADQNTVEPILIDAAVNTGAVHRFNTELLSFDSDENGVTARIQDRVTGERRTVRADYLIAADGNRSPIREKLGIARPDAYTFLHSR